MGRPFLRIEERVREPEKSELAEDIEEISHLLDEYLDTYIPRVTGYSKHSIMGPVGKLLSAIEGGKMYSKEALVGYVVNIHNQSSKTAVNRYALGKLEEAVTKLIELRGRVSLRTWIELVREIDYAVYKLRVAKIAERVAAKKGGGGK